MSQSKAKDMTTNYKDFITVNLGFTEVQDNERSKGQRIAYPRYKNHAGVDNLPVFLQLPWSKLFTYGVPREGEYYQTDQDRSHLKYPISFNLNIKLNII